MALSLFQITRWTKMFLGYSVEHVNQSIGKNFCAQEVKGYYNDLTHKVLIMPDLLKTDDLPLIKQADGVYIYFPVAIFQYALGCYDLYLQSSDNKYLNKFMQCAKWTLDNLDERGRWNNFFHTSPDAPFGAMAQGEGVSVLLRAYKENSDEIYLKKAKLAIDFMLCNINNGGTAKYINDDLYLMEFTHLPLVMNGWIFAWWGLFDYVLMTHDEGHYKSCLDRSLKTLIKTLPRFTNSFWSIYDFDNKIASPFYHNLHIAQMQAMYALTGQSIFDVYANKWERFQNNIFYKMRAIFIKGYQKIKE